jgi:hypothetical protein
MVVKNTKRKHPGCRTVRSVSVSKTKKEREREREAGEGKEVLFSSPVDGEEEGEGASTSKRRRGT